MTTGSTKVKTILISHLGSSGGGPKFTYHLFRALSGKSGVDAHYLISNGADNRGHFEQTGTPGITIPTYSTKLGLVAGMPRLLVSALRVRSYIRRNSISVVINAMDSIYQGLFAPLAVPKGVKYISCIHDADDHPGDEHIAKKLSRWGERRRADEFVVFSLAVADALRRRKFVGSRPVRLTVHGVYGSETAPVPRALEESNGEVRVGFLGRLGKYKGLNVLNDAIGILHKRGVNVSAWVYGAGPEASLASSAGGANLNWSVGWIDDDKIPGILDSFDVLVLPYIEASQSGVIAYALARGLPIVVTPVGALGEQVTQAKCGLIARSTAPEDVADSIECLVSDPVLRRKLGENALAASRTTFAWETVSEDFVGWLAD